MKLQRGFTLLELLVVITIIALISTFMIQNFARDRVDLGQSRSEIIEAIREAQARALAGVQYLSTYRCGYGIRLESGGYTIYAGPIADASCATYDRAYNVGIDPIVRSVTFAPNTLELVGSTLDIYFEPPNPATYICPGGTCGALTEIAFAIRRVGTTDTRTIYVSTSGLITAQ